MLSEVFAGNFRYWALSVFITQAFHRYRALHIAGFTRETPDRQYFHFPAAAAASFVRKQFSSFRLVQMRVAPALSFETVAYRPLPQPCIQLEI